MSIKYNDQEASEADDHVNDGENTVDGSFRVEVGKVIDGSDEAIPWEEKANAQSEVDDVAQIEFVFWF